MSITDNHIWLDIGSGDPSTTELQAQGYLKQDIEGYPGIDLVCDIRDLDKHLKPGQCAKIRASHVMEHFGTREVDGIYTMLYNLLEDGGELEVIVPNFRWHARLVQEGRDIEAVYYCFGGQLDAWDYHKTGYTPSILYQKLTTADFKDIQIEEQTSLICHARR